MLGTPSRVRTDALSIISWVLSHHKLQEYSFENLRGLEPRIFDPEESIFYPLEIRFSFCQKYTKSEKNSFYFGGTEGFRSLYLWLDRPVLSRLSYSSIILVEHAGLEPAHLAWKANVPMPIRTNAPKWSLWGGSNTRFLVPKTSDIPLAYRE